MISLVLFVLVVFFANVIVDTARLDGGKTGKFWVILFSECKVWAVAYWAVVGSKIQELLNKSI